MHHYRIKNYKGRKWDEVLCRRCGHTKLDHTARSVPAALKLRDCLIATCSCEEFIGNVYGDLKIIKYKIS